VNPLLLHDEIIRDFENHLMMFFTRIERDANDILGEQSEKLSKKSQVDVEKKGHRESNKETSKGHNTTESQILKPNLQEESDAVKAMHQIKEIGYRSKKALENGDCCLFGKLMHQHWGIKKTITKKMSSPQIDRWYDIAMNAGALGGKIMGAGGGGFFLFCVKNEKRKHVLSTLENEGLRYMDFRFDFEGSKVIANF
jgi:D-glycero-alpha-D-manno-heptose-7-phosphate kinase